MNTLIIIFALVLAVLIAFGRFRVVTMEDDPNLAEYQAMKPEIEALLAESRKTLQPERLPLP